MYGLSQIQLDLLLQKVEARILRTPHCWVWLRGRNSDGVPVVAVCAQQFRVPHLLYLMENPELETCKLRPKCSLWACCRPDHMELLGNGKGVPKTPVANTEEVMATMNYLIDVERWSAHQISEVIPLGLQVIRDYLTSRT